MTHLVLEEKVAASEALLTGLVLRAEAGELDLRRVFVAWTGGKDSTVTLALWRAVLDHHGLGPARAISIDTGCKFPEIVAFRDRMAEAWGIDLRVVRPEVDLAGYPVAQDKTSCCRELKVAPLNRALAELDVSHLITGIRRDEHPDRAGRAETERFDRPPHVRLNPIVAWTEMDVWAIISSLGLPYCELYDQGYRSLGCRPCTEKGAAQGERSGRAGDKERVLASLTDLGYF